MKKYETLFLFPSDLAETAAQKAFEELKKRITHDFSGEVTFAEWWGKRPLAYRIGTCETGFYALLQYTFPPEKLSEFDEELRIHPQVLRFLTMVAPEGKPLSYAEITAEERAFADEKSAGKRSAKKRSPRPEAQKAPVATPSDEEIE